MTDDNGSANAGNPAGGNAAPWYGADAGDDIKGFVELKGWTEPKAAIESYRNLEKLLGADKAGRAVVWPKDDNDADAWADIRARMGVPGKAEDYKLPVPEGDDGKFAQTFAPMLLEAGLSQKQAERLAGAWNQFQQSEMDRVNAEVERQVQADQQALKAEWGAAYTQNVELAARAAKALGMSEDDVADVIAASGYAKAQKWLAAVGEKIGEDRFAGADGRPVSRAYTPAAAQARLEQLMGDAAWLNRFASGDADALAEKARLDEAILSGRAAA